MAKPFVKWPGGKSQIIDDITGIIDSMRYGNGPFVYVEPFVGGGAVLFRLLSIAANLKLAVINDSNRSLMNCYRVISDNSTYSALKAELLSLESEYNRSGFKKEMYLAMRERHNSNLRENCLGSIESAAIFLFLNKTSFNGLYRVNSKGEFNVPWNQSDSVRLFDEDNLDSCHMLLNEKVIIMSGDYSHSIVANDIARVEKSNLIYYLDPPYRPTTQTSAFVNYTKDGFDDDEQRRLKSFCDMIDADGGSFLLSNSKSGDFFENLYEGYNIKYVGARRAINSNGDRRGKIEEILIYNTDIKEESGLF